MQTHTTRILLRFLKPYRVQIGLSLLLGILLAIFEGIGLGLLVPILQGVTTDGGLVSGNPILDRLSSPFETIPKDHRLQVLLLILVFVTALKNGVFYAHTYLSVWLRANFTRDLRCQIFDQLLRVGYQFLAAQRAGDLWNDLTNETNRAGQILVRLVQQVAILFVSLACVGLLITISWPLTLLAVVLLGALSFLLRALAKKSRKVGELITQSYAQHASVGIEALSAMRVIRLFACEQHERTRFEQAVRQANEADMRTTLVKALTVPFSEMFAIGLFAFIFLIATNIFIHRAEAVLPLLLTFLFVLYRLMPRVTQFNSNRVNIASDLPAVDAVAKLLSCENKPFIQSGSQPFCQLDAGIRFENVTFAYRPDDSPVLEEVTLEIPAGKTTAIVGASGAGKSTLVDLVSRFYDPDRGRISTDGMDIRTLDLSSWRSAIGVVDQETFVFNASIRDNIAYGRLEATDAEIEQASRQANAYGFISEMPQGFNTKIGDRGMRLSGGQRQRIAIARAVLRNPSILILDEATSALDTVSEKLVQQALEDLIQNRTVLVIAHRLSTIVNADQIVVLEAGRVVEKGVHRELLQQRGVYWQYHTLQFAQEAEPIETNA